MILALIALATVILAGGLGLRGLPVYGPETNPVASVDDGNTRRAETLLGTLTPVPVTISNLASLDGLWTWRDRFDREIYYLCDNQYRLVSPVLVKAIMAQESSFNPNAVRVEERIKDKSIGLMQLLTSTARWVAPFRDLSPQQIEERLYEPITNIGCGCKYLTWQIGRYGRDADGLPKVIAAYNAGSAKYDSSGNFVNHGYIANVKGRMKVYANDFPPLRTKA